MDWNNGTMKLIAVLEYISVVNANNTLCLVFPV